ncbi:TetR family transcriptional regulator [Mycolicibacterium sp.]|uniref:TetR/AcrR family transcriptional regulator n=1 Tax=Mycolicibacterium sp. TaxID=2320850 RepID=UPI001A1FFDD7|nr:TetR family transcriptional regulator [Mycolicibacterium sp.]MBJ7336068.1 TetR/AcrR family transcriptional regulator [Mycolicibacterium sp.]
MTDRAPDDAPPRSPAQTRVLDAALALFSEHGVSGTSLQMIADAIGVTKAAVYRQFQAKDDIVIAVTERTLAKLTAALEAAEAQPSAKRSRQVLLAAVIDVAIADRKAASTLQFDPVVVRLLSEHPPFQQFMTRLYGALIGDVGDEARLGAAMLSGAIGVAVMHPLAADVDDDTLRTYLLRQTRRFIT